ncbi:hypothetical protein IFM89_033413 [Coptis chinensis]|uniref:Uncharacterized protein n=1 Tax=Coptis chinensis TaxID=261450 RepID=A0A835HYR6_9MAGN|nr:hypothetical protein IFM89_033413 [Coptis chinensis]
MEQFTEKGSNQSISVAGGDEVEWKGVGCGDYDSGTGICCFMNMVFSLGDFSVKEVTVMSGALDWFSMSLDEVHCCGGGRRVMLSVGGGGRNGVLTVDLVYVVTNGGGAIFVVCRRWWCLEVWWYFRLLKSF